MNRSPGFVVAAIAAIVKGDWVWFAPDGAKRGDKRRVFKELGYGRPGDHDVSNVDLATQVGLYGWELTPVLEREKGTEIGFRRPVRSFAIRSSLTGEGWLRGTSARP